MSEAPSRPPDPAVRRALRVGVLLIGLLVLLAALWHVRDVLMLAFLAVLLALVFSFPVGWLQRVMPRGLAVLAVLLLFLGGLGLLGWRVAPVLAEQARELTRSAPQALQDARQWLEHAQRSMGPEGGGAQKPAQPAPAVTVSRAAQLALPAAFTLAEAATTLVLLVVLAAFLVHQPQAYVRGVRRLVPRAHEPVFDEAVARLTHALRQWVGGILVSMLIMGTLTGAGLAIAGIHNWLLLGFITFLGTFVPYVGAIASAVPGLLAGLAQSSHHLLLAMAVYLGIHVVEGYLVQPYVMRRAVEVRPALLLFGQSVALALLGVMGAVVATPLLVCVQVLVGYLWVERRLHKQG
ncbi:AI-2E family transporter [Aggregicoccus sp. 17bor-14]|uniref:AI-2E family transporter n=1 Tax=Myxococcaceae TaxID=31 RepID=UPI00129C3B24|nr:MULTISPECIES: AI-2E family transporter [Myxococcaceae]MBF5046518.1 AI-2E family transporter [Simulacricoccus sp. 17bor-14]MRI92233.1 AI-2E family transporter [Aggregicoccus sp. 17bor-14]